MSDSRVLAAARPAPSSWVLRAALAVVAGVLLAVASTSTRAASLPASGVDASDVFALYVDVAAVEPEQVRQTLTALSEFQETLQMTPLGELTGDEDNLDPAEGTAKYTTFREQFLGAGGEAIVLLGDPQSGDPRVLVKTNGTADPAGLKAAMLTVADEDGSGAMQDATLEALEPGWLIATGPEAAAAPAEPDAARADAFVGALNSMQDRPAAFVFMFSDTMKQDIRQGAAGAGPMAGLANAFASMDAMVGGAQLGADPTMLMRFDFPDAQTSQAFATQWSAAMNMGQAMVGMMVAQGAQQGGAAEAMPTPQDVADMFQSLQLTGEGASRSLTIDRDLVSKIAKLAPLAMMMGGGGGAGPGGGF